MACTTQEQKIYDYIKSKRIDTENISWICSGGTETSLKWWRNPFGLETVYSIEYIISASNYIQILFRIRGCQNPKFEPCDDCVRISGTMTDAQIDTALASLPFVTEPPKGVSVSWGVIGIVGIGGLAALYYITKRK